MPERVEPFGNDLAKRHAAARGIDAHVLEERIAGAARRGARLPHRVAFRWGSARRRSRAQRRRIGRWRSPTFGRAPCAQTSPAQPRISSPAFPVWWAVAASRTANPLFGPRPTGTETAFDLVSMRQISSSCGVQADRACHPRRRLRTGRRVRVRPGRFRPTAAPNGGFGTNGARPFTRRGRLTDQSAIVLDIGAVGSGRSVAQDENAHGR